MLAVIQSLLTAIVLFFSVVLVNLNDKHLKLLLFYRHVQQNLECLLLHNSDSNCSVPQHGVNDDKNFRHL